jgi:hypothetical protein
MLPVFLDDFHSSLEIAEIIQSVENTEDIDAIVAGPLHKSFTFSSA